MARVVVNVVIFSRPGCHLCDEAMRVIEEVRRGFPFALSLVDVSADSTLEARYGRDIPVVTFDGREIFRHRVDATAFRERLVALGVGS